VSAKTGVVLGSGLGGFTGTIENRVETPYAEIPGWPVSTAIGHAGRVVTGTIAGVDVVVLAGRAHFYEGYSAQQIVFGIRTLAARGIRNLILTNAAGGINPDFEPGDLVLISDHINLLGVNPLTGPNDEALGPRFPDMTDAYSLRYREIVKEAGAELGIHLREGVYAAVPGPSYETPAEIRYLRIIGADLVGMSTVPEAIAGNHLGMNVLGISCVTNKAAGLGGGKLDHKEVLAVGERAQAALEKLLRTVIPRLE
jgi:purine-nucleoside phosphorylase